MRKKHYYSPLFTLIVTDNVNILAISGGGQGEWDGSSGEQIGGDIGNW